MPPCEQEEHAEYVRSMATLSALMSGFVNVAFVQFGFDPTQVPYPVLMGFGITNALTVSAPPFLHISCHFEHLLNSPKA